VKLFSSIREVQLVLKETRKKEDEEKKIVHECMQNMLTLIITIVMAKVSHWDITMINDRGVTGDIR
jgi:hypothetical protein